MRTFLVRIFLLLFFVHLLLTPNIAAQSEEEVSKDPIIYFVMVDRFANGDPGNDLGGQSGGPEITGFDGTNPGFFHGGDIAGLEEKLDYIQSLGFTAIWITPVVRQVPLSPTNESAAYHGYWGAGFDEVDPRFGTMAEMKSFVTAAHSRGMKVYLDVVVNHTGDLISYEDGETYLAIKDHPYRRSDGRTFNPIKVANSKEFPTIDQLDPLTSFPKRIKVNTSIQKSPSWLNDPRNYHNRGNFSSSGESSTFGDFYGLDDLFTESPVVEDGWVEVFGDWISEVGIDGFRLDTYKHVNPEFWQGFLPKIKEIARKESKEYFPMWGEIYDFDPARITDWIKRTGLGEALDFPVQGAIAGYVIDENAKQLAEVFDNDDLYITETSDASRNGTFLGNHDMGRIGGFIYNRYRDSHVALKKLEIAHALLYSIRGVPIVYYGDEFGMIGGRDKAARQSLFPTKVREWQSEPRIGMDPIGSGSYFDMKHPLQESLRELSLLRSQYPALRNGYQSVAHSKNGLLALTRIDPVSKKELLFLFNATGKQGSISVRDSAGFSVLRGTAEISERRVLVPALSWTLMARDLQESSSNGKVTLLKIGKYKYDPSLFFIRARVDGLKFPSVRFEYRGIDGSWKSMGVDSSPKSGSNIYRIAPPRSSLPQGQQVRIRAVALTIDGSEVRSKAILLRLPK